MFTSRIWVHGEMDPIGELTTNDFWYVKELDTKITMDFVL